MPNESQALPLRIKVLDGPLSVAQLMAGMPAGIVELEGWSAPFRPIKYGQSMRRKTTFYPGNPEGTQQIIGKTYKPTTFTGFWPDRYLGDGAARALVAVFEQILDAGASVEVTWGTGIAADDSTTAASGYVRVGILGDFDFSPERPQDVGWEMTFEWRGKGDSFAPPVAPADVQNPREGFQAAVGDLLTAKAASQTFLDSLRSPIPQAAIDAIGAAVTNIDAATQSIQAVSSIATTTANFPASTARALVGACGTAIDAATGLRDAMLSIDPAKLLLPVDDAALYLNAKIRTFFMLGTADAARASATQTADGIAAQIEPDVIAQVRAPAGVDLRDLALQYYGDADAWWSIADYNDMDSSEVPAPPIGPADRAPLLIRIPRLQPGPQSDLRQNC